MLRCSLIEYQKFSYINKYLIDKITNRRIARSWIIFIQSKILFIFYFNEKTINIKIQIFKINKKYLNILTKNFN